MGEEIRAFHDHPDTGKLLEYSLDPPSGIWTGRLDDYAWGTSSNLFCFITHTNSGRKYRLSVYSQNDFRPSKESPRFDQEPLGGMFEIAIGKRAGMPVFLWAKKIS